MLGMREWRRLRRCGRSERQSQEYAAGGSESPRRRPESKEKRACVQRGQEKRGGRASNGHRVVCDRANGRLRFGCGGACWDSRRARACKGNLKRTESRARAGYAKVVRKGEFVRPGGIVGASWRPGVCVGPPRCRGGARWRRARVRNCALLTCIGATWTFYSLVYIVGHSNAGGGDCEVMGLTCGDELDSSQGHV